jgi:hypothetical protein
VNGWGAGPQGWPVSLLRPLEIAGDNVKILRHDCTFITKPKDQKQQAARRARRQRLFEKQRQSLEQLRSVYLPKASLEASRIQQTIGPGAQKAGHPFGVVTCGAERLVDDSPDTTESKRRKAGQDRS